MRFFQYLGRFFKVVEGLLHYSRGRPGHKESIESMLGCQHSVEQSQQSRWISPE